MFKRVFAALLALCLCAGLAACGRPSDEEIKAVRNVAVENGELIVTLGTNKSTGYEWNFEIFGECVEISPHRVFTLTGTHGQATGELGIGFKGVSEGSASILFTTPVGWDGTGPGDAYTVNVTVGADGVIQDASGKEGDTTGQVRKPPENELLSAPYAEMLRSGDYQYSYPVEHEGKTYIATVAAKEGMGSLSLEATDGSYSKRNVTINGETWQIDDLTGQVVEAGEEEAQIPPDFKNTLVLVGTKTLSNGSILDAYDFESQGETCNIVFCFFADKTFAGMGMILHDGENTTELEASKLISPSDGALFDAPANK